MGVDIHYEYYPKECKNEMILPFLSYETTRWLNGKHLPIEFYNSCNELAEWNDDNECWIFDDIEKLFKFAAKTEVPVVMSDFIAGCDFLQNSSIKHKFDDIFVIWKR